MTGLLREGGITAWRAIQFQGWLLGNWQGRIHCSSTCRRPRGRVIGMRMLWVGKRVWQAMGQAQQDNGPQWGATLCP